MCERTYAKAVETLYKECARHAALWSRSRWFCVLGLIHQQVTFTYLPCAAAVWSISHTTHTHANKKQHTLRIKTRTHSGCGYPLTISAPANVVSTRRICGACFKHYSLPVVERVCLCECNTDFSLPLLLKLYPFRARQTKRTNSIN